MKRLRNCPQFGGNMMTKCNVGFWFGPWNRKRDMSGKTGEI